jgi:hypothetical protein
MLPSRSAPASSPRSWRQAQAFIEAGKQFDMMILPGQDHGYTGAGPRFAETYVRNYFETHLMTTKSNPEGR